MEKADVSELAEETKEVYDPAQPDAKKPCKATKKVVRCSHTKCKHKGVLLPCSCAGLYCMKHFPPGMHGCTSQSEKGTKADLQAKLVKVVPDRLTDRIS
jgi:hypothetical protein